MMNFEDYDYWFDRTALLSLRSAQQLADGVSYLVHEGIWNNILPLSDIQQLNKHYYRMSLAYAVVHARDIQRVAIQERAYNSFGLFHALKQQYASSLSDTYFERHAALEGLLKNMEATRERPSFEELNASGLHPSDFQALLKLMPQQQRWVDLSNLQLRHFDYKGHYHAVVRFETPSEELDLFLLYREAEGYGLTVGAYQQVAPDLTPEIDEVSVQKLFALGLPVQDFSPALFNLPSKAHH